MLADLMVKKNDDKYIKMLQMRAKLPAWAAQQDICAALDAHQVAHWPCHGPH
jgi:HrpA-like RNA helicase